MTTDHQPLPSVEDQLCRDRVVLRQVCNCPVGALALGFPRWRRPRSGPTCFLPRATLPELYSNLTWLLLVLGLEIPR